MIDFLKETMRPSSTVFLVMLLAPGVVLLYIPGLARWGRRWLSTLLVVYWILSAPITVRLLARTLTYGYAPVGASQVSGTEAVVLLSAGTLNFRSDGQQLPVLAPGSAMRTLEAARVYRLAGSPIVIASGGVNDKRAGAAPESEALRLALLNLAVPADRIVSESQSKNTRDEAIIVSEMIRARGITRVVMVTSPLHMRRSMVVFARQGLNPIPAVAPLDRVLDDPDVVPKDAALIIGDEIVYEWAARLYYWWQGWLS